MYGFSDLNIQNLGKGFVFGAPVGTAVDTGLSKNQDANHILIMGQSV